MISVVSPPTISFVEKHDGKKMSTKKYQVTTKETTTLVSEMLLWLSPETITTEMIPGSFKR